MTLTAIVPAIILATFGALYFHSVTVTDETIVSSDGAFVKNGKSLDLVILLHSYGNGPESLRHVEAVVGDKDRGYPDADVFKPSLPFAITSMARPEVLTARLIAHIDRIWDEKSRSGTPYRRIIIVGHSIGALFARKLYVVARGETEAAPFDPLLCKSLCKSDEPAPEETRFCEDAAPERPWAEKIKRIVLLASMNKGWDVSHHFDLTRMVASKIGIGAGHILEALWGRPPLIFTVRRGRYFITQLRLQWLAMREHSKGSTGQGATVVQLLGTIDDIVSPHDNVDLVTGREFFYLEVPYSGHDDVIRIDDPMYGKGRGQALLDALSLPRAGLREKHFLPDEPPAPRREVTDVVFVIHGIRDEGFWTEKVARRIQKMGEAQKMGKAEGRTWAAVTSSYGYFPMLSFLNPGAREAKLGWLMEQYTDAKARYPAAMFHFVGHSHGTHLLARALEQYRAVTFGRIVFAGSVVPTGYDWSKYKTRDQIGGIVNFVASGHAVVAWFPKAFEMLRLQDLGSAGHDGFKIAQDMENILVQPDDYVSGDHGAAKSEPMWDFIATYIATGTYSPPARHLMQARRTPWIANIGAVAPVVWIAILVALVLIGIVILIVFRSEWKRTLAPVAYAYLIFFVITEV